MIRLNLSALLAVSIALPACAQSPAPLAAPTARATAGPPAWKRLKSTLPGSWTLPSKNGHPFVVSYKLISRGSVLVEEWGQGTPNETETVFHLDHTDLMLTHYCAQGNQPRLRVVQASPDAIVFRFADVTNRAPDQAMLRERTIRFGGDNSFDDTEIYVGSDGKDDITTYRFVRAARSSDAETH